VVPRTKTSASGVGEPAEAGDAPRAAAYASVAATLSR
jgi:hypothetical protein